FFSSYVLYLFIIFHSFLTLLFFFSFFFFKQKTAYEIGLGIPAEPLFRSFVPEHGTMFTLALVRFPPTATKEIQYLNAKGALTYTDIAGDPVLYGNLPPREI